ncbi:MAG: Ig-like domain-containing protein [Lachnospiraceae bacterium]|nr:Ig-like domain-containing protein [Lachnospiraceae bacterium]
MKLKMIHDKMFTTAFLCALLLGILLFDVTGYCENTDADNNGTYETAVALPMKRAVSDSLNATDDTDIFKIVVERNSYVMFLFTASFRSPNFKIENENRNQIATRYVNGSLNEPETYKYIAQMAAGTYYIKATTSGSTGGGDYSIYVTDEQPTAITIDQTELQLEDSTSSKAELKVVTIPQDSIQPEIEWQSGDVYVARVDKGTVTANGIGYTAVTAAAKEFPNLQATCTVTVKPRQVANVNQDTQKTDRKKLAVTCSMGYSAARMPDGFNFYIFDKNAGKYVLKGSSEKNEFTFKGLKQETGYKVKVSAYINTPAGKVEGALSNEKMLYTAPKQLKATKITGIKKKNLTTYQGGTVRIFNLKWKKVKGATSYKVYGQQKSGSKFTLMETTQKPNADMYAGVGYTYKVYVVPVKTKHGVSTEGKKSPKYTIDMRE